MKFAIIGAMGRMGQAIAHLSLSLDELTLVAAVEKEESLHVKKNYGSLIGLTNETHRNQLSFPLITLNELNNMDVDGLIDFSSPESTLNSLQQAESKKIPIVMGTTGFQPNDIQKIQSASQNIPVLLSSNMSLGANLLFWLVQKASQVLKSYNFDPEIMEIHHNQKKDAPSGTAVTLEKTILHEFGWDEKTIQYGRSGLIGKRSQKELGSHALRGGDVAGEHTVYFLGDGERIELTHRANNRNIFASGALQSLIFLSAQKPGLYHMKDVLNLK